KTDNLEVLFHRLGLRGLTSAPAPRTPSRMRDETRNGDHARLVAGRGAGDPALHWYPEQIGPCCPAGCGTTSASARLPQTIPSSSRRIAVRALSSCPLPLLPLGHRRPAPQPPS